MKKFAAGLLVAAIMINGAVAFAADGAITSISTDPDTQYITVSGTIASGTGRERVTLRITKKDETPNKNTIVCTYQVNADENGAYSFGFTMPDGAAAEEYDAYVKADGAEDKQSFRYFGDVSSELQAKVNAATSAAALKTFLEADNNAGMEMFGINADEYRTLSESGKSFVVSAVYSAKQSVGGFDNGKQLRDAFDQAVLIEKVREGKTEITDDNIEALTVDYTKTVGGGYGTILTAYNSAKKADASVTAKAIAAAQGSSVKDAKTFWSAYNNSVTNTVIANTEYWTEVRDFIADNKELIGEYANIDWTKYNSNAQAVCKQLVRGNYATFGTFAAAVKSAIDEAVNPSSSNSAAGGGGGGGGSSSGSDNSIKSSSVTLPVPETTYGTTENTAKTVTSDPYKFDDVRRTPWANGAVSYLVDRKIISGYGDGTFKPENSITRAEFVTLVIKAFYGSYEMTDCDFDDVPKDSWAYPYIAAASNLGLVQGVGENEFAPDTNIKRQDMAVIIKNILDTTEHSGYTEGTKPFDDENEVSGYALDAVNALRAEGIVNGDENNNFKPLAQTTRAEAAVIIYNMLNK